MGECGPGPEFNFSKQCKSDGRVKIYNSVSARSPGSVPHTMAEARQIVSALIRNRTHVARLSAARLNHYVIGSYRLLKKNGCMFRRIS